MPNFNSLQDIEKFLTQKINKALEKEVAEQARATMKETIEDVVYDPSIYTPTKYVRQREHGGLLDDENIHTGLIDDGELVIRNTRSNENDDELGYDNSEYRDVAAIVEYGTNYNWTRSRIYKMQPYPTPFHKVTAQRLDEKGLAKRAMKKGLQNQGLDVE